MEITYEKGKYGKGDKIILVDGHRIELWELADMIVTHDRIRRYEEQDTLGLINMLNDCMGMEKVTDEILNLYYHTKSEEDIARIAVELYNNEERIHPRKDGFKGGEYFRDFLNACWCEGEVSEEILDHFGLNAPRV